MYNIDDFFAIFNYLKNHPDQVDTHIANVDQENSDQLNEYIRILRLRDVYLRKIELAESYKYILINETYTIYNFKYYVSLASTEMYSYIEFANTEAEILIGLNTYIVTLNNEMPPPPSYTPTVIEQSPFVTDGLNKSIAELAIVSRNETKTLFKNVIDQIAFNTNDYKKLRNFIIDWYSTFRTLLKLQNFSKDPFSMTTNLLNVALASFGYTEGYLIRRKDFKAALLLFLVDIYKKKGSPQSIIEFLHAIGINDVCIYEWWLYRERTANRADGELYLEAYKVTKMTDDTAEAMLQTNRYMSYDEFKRVAGPHWYYTEEKIKEIDNALDKLTLPSIMPYFSIAIYMDFSKIQQLGAFLNKFCNDLFVEYIQKGTFDNNDKVIYIEEFDTTITILELYLGLLYAYNKYNDYTKYKELKNFITLTYGFDPESKLPTPFTGLYPFRYEKLLNWCVYNIDLEGNWITLSGYNKYPNDVEIFTDPYYIGQGENIDLNYDNNSLATSLINYGNWNALTNSPDISTTPAAGYWIVTTAGNTNLGGITNWKVGDYAIYSGEVWTKGPLSTHYDVNYFPYIIVHQGSRYVYLLHYNNILEKNYNPYSKADYESILDDEWFPLFERFKSSKDILMIYPSVYKNETAGLTYLPLDGWGYKIDDLALIEKDETQISDEDFKTEYDLLDIVKEYADLPDDGVDYVIGDRILVRQDFYNDISLTPSIYECIAIYEDPLADPLVLLSRELQWKKISEQATIIEWNRNQQIYYPQVYKCIAITGTLAEQWQKIDDENIEEWIRLWNLWLKKKFNLGWTMPFELNFSRNRLDAQRILAGNFPSKWVERKFQLPTTNNKLNEYILVKKDETKGYYPSVYVCKIENISSYDTTLLTYQTTWDAKTNTPSLSELTASGQFWVVSDAGTPEENTELGGINDWVVGDYVVKTSDGWIKGPWVYDPDGMYKLQFGVNPSILTQIDQYCVSSEELYFELVDIFLGYLNIFIATYLQDNPINIQEFVIGSGRKIKKLIKDIKPKRARLLSYDLIYGINDALFDSLNVQDKPNIQAILYPSWDHRETIRDSADQNYDTINPYYNNLSFQGTWNAFTNTPNISSATTGQYWIVSVEGVTNLGGITNWKVGDYVVKSDIWNSSNDWINLEILTNQHNSGWVKGTGHMFDPENVFDDKPLITVTERFELFTINNGSSPFDPSISKSGLPVVWNMGDGNTVAGNSISYTGYTNVTPKSVRFNSIDSIWNINSVIANSDQLLDARNLHLLINLSSVNLSSNYLTSIYKIEEWAGLSSLSTLDLSNNDLTCLDLSRFTHLTSLNISNNELNYIGELNDLSSLIHLSVANNHLNEIGEITNLTHLATCDVSINSLTDIGYIHYLTNLTSFIAEFNLLTELGNLSNLIYLRTFNVRNNQLTNILNFSSPEMTLFDIRDNLISSENLTIIVNDLWTLRSSYSGSVIKLENNEKLNSATAIEQIEGIGSYVGNGLKPNNTVTYDVSNDAPTLVTNKNGLFNMVLAGSCNLCTDLFGTGITYQASNTINYTYSSGAIKNVRIYADNYNQLTRISAANDNISATNNLDQLAGLQILNLSGNSISSLDLFYFTELQDLNMGYNSALLITNIERCLKLETLYINNCNLSNEFSIQNNSALEILDLSDNSLTFIGYLSYFHNMRILNLSNNNLTTIGDLTELTQLTQLNLSNNNFDTIGSLRDMSDLTRVYLNDNNFSEPTLSGLVDDLWRNRGILGSNSCVIDLSNNNGLSSIAISQINGTGSYVGQGLITYGCTVTY